MSETVRRDGHEATVRSLAATATEVHAMTRRSILGVSSVITVLVAAIPALAGGPPSFSFHAPSTADAKAVLVVHAYSCHMPTDATVLARAEGLVNGQRREIPLTLTPTSETGVYSVYRQWPAEGSWALMFSVDRGGQTTALVQLGPKGEPILESSGTAADRALSDKYVRTLSGKASARDIEAALSSNVASNAK